jgi:hypothetical protein
MSDYVSRPWLALYGERPAFQRSRYDTALEMFDATVAARGDDIALHYFDGATTWTQLDRAADSLAAYMQTRGFRSGDRLAICTQNNPALVIGLVAAWKAGGAAVLISPMSTLEEFGQFLGTYRPSGLLVLGDIYRDIARTALTDISDTCDRITVRRSEHRRSAGAGGISPAPPSRHSRPVCTDRRPHPAARPVHHRARRHRGAAQHIRHHGISQGRCHHARQPHVQHSDLPELDRCG